MSEQFMMGVAVFESWQKGIKYCSSCGSPSNPTYNVISYGEPYFHLFGRQERVWFRVTVVD
ncbi:hypothetical protein AFK24_15490 [Pseudomonas syringae]|uniref:Uncharacterized protein n=1 Tax=Pseudomonas syringae TaxID=317 RepID=A0A1C7Z4S6_PSESX|nr:hypothetical protein AFK24_15490 [Pseudomonas syringae]